MADDHIRYDLLTQDALRGVVRRVLADVAKNGLPGEHHFFISFDTRAPGVKISPRLFSQYPREMTIVLQHQYWDLIVSEQGFEVGLSFGGVAERLSVPFAAVNGFFDPSVQFGLQFQDSDKPTSSEQDNESDFSRAPGAAPREAAGGSIVSPDPRPIPTIDTDPGPRPDQPSAEVVRLDRFRKK